MPLPKKITEEHNGVRIEAKSFKRNFLIYRSIGCVVTATAEKRRRRWFCLWLCKTRVRKKVPIISIRNTYYIRTGGTELVEEVPQANHNTTCNNASKCKLRQFVVATGFIPEGVVSLSTVSLNGELHTFVTAIGPQPEQIIQ